MGLTFGPNEKCKECFLLRKKPSSFLTQIVTRGGELNGVIRRRFVWRETVNDVHFLASA